MLKEEWEILRALDRKVNYVTSVCRTIEGNSADIKALEKEVSDMKEVVDDFKDILERRRKFKRILYWGISVMVAAALTAGVNSYMGAYLPPRDNGAAVPDKIGDNHGGTGQ